MLAYQYLITLVTLVNLSEGLEYIFDNYNWTSSTNSHGNHQFVRRNAGAILKGSKPRKTALVLYKWAEQDYPKGFQYYHNPPAPSRYNNFMHNSKTGPSIKYV